MFDVKERKINSEVVGNLLMFIPFGILYSLAKKKPSIKNTLGRIHLHTVD